MDTEKQKQEPKLMTKEEWELESKQSKEEPKLMTKEEWDLESKQSIEEEKRIQRISLLCISIGVGLYLLILLIDKILTIF